LENKKKRLKRKKRDQNKNRKNVFYIYERNRLQFASLSCIFYGVSLADESCRRRWPPPTPLALTTLLD